MIQFEANTQSLDKCSEVSASTPTPTLFPIQIDQAREALGAKALTQSQLIEEVEKELDRMAEQRSKKE